MLATLVLLYAEIHYSFRGIYSRLKNDEPEIIADAPHRIEPGQDIPVMLMVKDGDRYPIVLKQLSSRLMWPGGETLRTVDLRAQVVEQRIWSRVFAVPRPSQITGDVQLDILITFTRKGEERQVKIDNYRHTSHAPLAVHLAARTLPGADGWHFGEIHCHTDYTEDQVEFGAPLRPTRTLAQALGLTFFCATDHSYDLDDVPGNFLKKDPELRKWRCLWQEASALNAEDLSFVIIPGEEVSVGNHKNRNVHFLVLNNPEFLYGDGDSAEKWFQTQPTTSIGEVLERSNSNSAAFAAHPAVRPPLLQRLFVRRGQWEMPDFDDSRLHGLQVWNGTEEGLQEGIRCWVALLLQGRRLFICGGNDAHGNFARFRQIGFPFLTMRENGHHLFGKVRTAVFLPGRPTLDDLLMAMKRGNMVVTDGPFLDLRVMNDSEQLGRPGDQLAGQRFQVTCTSLSSPEYGGLTSMTVYLGDFDTESERVLFHESLFDDAESHKAEYSFSPRSPHKSYIRAELHSSKGTRQFKCYTNPIWLLDTE